MRRRAPGPRVAAVLPRVAALMMGAAALGLWVAAGPPGGAAAAPPASGAAPGAVSNPPACADCHRQGAGWLTRKSVHAPVRGGDCLACHGAHATREPMLVRRSGARVCTGCHADLRAAIQSGGAHAALTQDKACLACHDPHASDRARLLKDEPAALCRACHEVPPAPAPAHRHAPAAGGDCLACHDPHAAARPYLLKKSEPALCTACHRPADAKTVAAHRGFPVAASRCTGCHAPHASPRASLVRANVHLPFGEKECAACHQAGKTAIPAATRAGLCVTCHEERGSGHPVPQPAGCTACHAPHASSGPALDVVRHRQVCLRCHQDQAEQRAGAVSVHPAPGGMQDCTACHGIHAGQTASLLKQKDAQATCASCHGTHSQFSHPMGENVKDPSHPGRSVSCLSCHDVHGTTYPRLLLADPRQDLCRRCHADGGA